MPYASDAQRRFFHSPGAAKAGIKPKTVKEFDAASKGKSLPPFSPWVHMKKIKGVY